MVSHVSVFQARSAHRLQKPSLRPPRHDVPDRRLGHGDGQNERFHLQSMPNVGVLAQNGGPGPFHRKRRPESEFTTASSRPRRPPQDRNRHHRRLNRRKGHVGGRSPRRRTAAAAASGPNRPTRPWIESLNGQLEGEYPHPESITDIEMRAGVPMMRFESAGIPIAKSETCQ